MSDQQIMDLVLACSSFPEVLKKEIPRATSLDTIENMFNNDIHLVIVEGGEGIGKTTLLSQFARRHPNHTLSLFITSTSRLGYDPDTLREDLSAQLQWALSQKNMDLPESVDDSLLRVQLGRLKRRAHSQRETFYFVIDGLDEVPAEGIKVIILDMLDLLPWGLPRFRFLLSGNYDQFTRTTSKQIRVRPLPLARFRPDETKAYLADVIDEENEQLLEDIHHTCHGIPGRLADVRRNLEAGTPLKVVLDNMSKLFEIEWARVNTEDPLQLRLLGLIAFSHRNHSLADFARMLTVETSEVEKLLAKLSFVKYQELGVSFVSKSFQKFVEGKLGHFRNLKSEVTNILINDLFMRPDDEESRREIPVYLEQEGRYDKLLEYLTPEHCTRVLELSQSMALVRQHLDLGIKTALELRRNGEFVKFSVQRSIVSGLQGIDTQRSEIEARLSLDDYDTALTLAQSVTLKQDQLHLLAIIAKERKEQGVMPEQELMEQIRQLCNQLDFSTLGEAAIDIASDLVYSNQDLAIRMVEQAVKADTDGKAADWAFVGLSAAALGASREQSKEIDTVEVIRSRIKDPKLRRFSAQVSLMLGNYSASQVITKVKELEDTRDQLFLLRSWTMENREREDAVEVVDFAYQLAINFSAEEYIPTSDLRAIATPLPFIKDEAKAKELVDKFNTQLGITEKYGPTTDHVRLQLLLAWTESNYDFAAARTRVEEIYYLISDVADLVTKVQCLARLASTLTYIDPNKDLEEIDRVHSLVEAELKNNLEKLLDTTAEHYYATRQIVTALAKTKPALALDFIEELNIEARRDKALLDFVETAIKLPLDKLDLGSVQTAVAKIASKELRGEAIFQVITRLAVLSDKTHCLPGPLMQDALYFINSISDIQDSQRRCNAYCLAYDLLLEQSSQDYSALVSVLLAQLDQTWQEIDVRWIKVDVGFKIARSLAKSAPEKAQSYLTLAKQARNECILDTRTAAMTYVQALRLAIRAYAGLLPSKLNTPDDMDTLRDLIGRVPAYGEQAGLWAELALWLSTTGYQSECEHIVTNQVKPLLAKVSKNDTDYWTEVVVTLAPALYRTHLPTALIQIADLPALARDRAYAAVCDFLLQQKPPSEPFDYIVGNGYQDLNYENAISICELLELTESDGQIYCYIASISDSIASRRDRDRLPAEQLLALVGRLENVINRKLPDPTKRNITHSGYRIIAQAEILRLKELSRNKPALKDWLELIEAARCVPNLSDKALVLFSVGTVMPSRESRTRKQVLEEAMELVQHIPTTLDRVWRYVNFASMAYPIDKGISKTCLNLAMGLTFQADEEHEYFSAQRQIIDLASRIDTDYANSLAKIVDDEPARIKNVENVKKNIQDHLQLLKLKKQMAELSPKGDIVLPSSKDDFSHAAWMNLAALNAGRLAPVHFDNMSEFIKTAANLPLGKSYPILAWVITNAIQRLADTSQAANLLRPLFDAMVMGTRLSERLAVNSSKQLAQAISYTASTPSSNSLLILGGERDKAIKFIRNWFACKLKDYLKIHDPYFGPDDLEVLQLLLTENPNCKVEILTSQEHQEREKISTPWEESYRAYWSLHISDQDPPDTDIVIVGTKSRKSPIHDRWWLTNGAGLRIGTSLNGLGGVRVSEISELTPDEVEARQKIVDQYLYGRIREYEGERITRWQFPL